MLAVCKAYERLGSPEGDISIACLVIYLATALKSNAVYKAFRQARDIAAKTGSLSLPLYILNASTKMMTDMGDSANYVYGHDDPDGFLCKMAFQMEWIPPAIMYLLGGATNAK